ncbi:MAG: InlB B-repeat-containing protein, partial [Bacillota bacterium]
PITTLQIILQKEGFDYLTIGDNYIVGNRDRLYGDFTDRMFLARYDLFYVSASDMESYIAELGMSVQSLSVESNQRTLWMQGTPMTLGKAREIINTLDVIDNASFAEGGGRKVRMPVAMASGNRAEEELEALVDFLSILLDGFRDGRTDMGWVTWDHPDPLPQIYMDWDSPVIEPYDIKMKITRDFANNNSDQIRYLVAEGTPDNIELVNQMISTISGTPSTPITFEVGDEDIGSGASDSVEWIPDNQQQSVSRPSYEISLIGVPESGGTLSGEGSYAEGSSVTITADPAEGYKFVRWIENGSEFSTSETYNFTIYGDRKLEAVFISDQNDSSSDSEDSNDE